MPTRKNTSVKYKKLVNEVSDSETDGSDGELDNVPEKTPGYDGDDESNVLEQQAKQNQFDYLHFNSKNFSPTSSVESSEESVNETEEDTESSDGYIEGDMDEDQFGEEWDHVEAEEIEAVMVEEEMEESDA